MDVKNDSGQCWTIVSGRGHRGYMHATVWRGGKMVHDPHPDSTGIDEPLEMDIFVAIDPSKFNC